jgi:excinuclease ABC subunit C
MDIKEKVKSLPLSCGVYIMKSKEGKILYVGKASSLRKRVSSYFSSRASLKTGFLLEQIADIEYIVSSTEEQALILEAALIKEKKPKYNTALRDDKSYPYVEITRDDFPRVFISRPKKKTDSFVSGPYPKAKPLKDALKLIRRIFPYRSCSHLPKNACLFFHLQLCPAPCIGKISYREYRENIKGIAKILGGERKELLEELERKMGDLARESRFEEAATARDKLLSLHNLYQGEKIEHELISLKRILNLPRIPLIIEAIDISSLGGQEAAGSVVVFKDATPLKDSYRRYRIKEVRGIDDYAMIREVVKRRYRRLLEEKKSLPQLVIIDGGLAHVDTAKQELDKLGLFIPLVGIAKKNEEIWFPQTSQPLIIPRNDQSLHLIQRIRDEAHRFARKYHLLLRRKKVIIEKQC